MSTERTWERRTIAAKGLQSLGFRGAEIVAQAMLIAVTARFLGPSGRGLDALAALASVSSPFRSARCGRRSRSTSHVGAGRSPASSPQRS